MNNTSVIIIICLYSHTISVALHSNRALFPSTLIFLLTQILCNFCSVVLLLINSFNLYKIVFNIHFQKIFLLSITFHIDSIFFSFSTIKMLYSLLIYIVYWILLNTLNIIIFSLLTYILTSKKSDDILVFTLLYIHFSGWFLRFFHISDLYSCINLYSAYLQSIVYNSFPLQHCILCILVALFSAWFLQLKNTTELAWVLSVCYNLQIHSS